MPTAPEWGTGHGCHSGPRAGSLLTRVNDLAGQVGRIPDTEASVEAAELARRAAEYPQHRLTCEATMAGGVRYIAEGLGLDAHPSVVLAAGRRPR
jgi:hypothetical protein